MFHRVNQQINVIIIILLHDSSMYHSVLFKHPFSATVQWRSIFPTHKKSFVDTPSISSHSQRQCLIFLLIFFS